MKNFTYLIILTCLTLLFLPLFKSYGQGNNGVPVDCNYTDGSCISIGYVFIQFVPGNPDVYELSVDYEINQGGDTGCPEVRRIRFTPSHQNSGDIEIGDDQEIIGTATIRVVANAFDAQDRTLTMAIDYESGQTRRIELRAPDPFECGTITPLPVELISFKGKATESGISLEWETASELNNSHFEIERSTDGKQFASIGTVKGRGTTSTRSDYKLTDKDPEDGINYYRLKQVDFDRTFSYSRAIAVKWKAGDAMKMVLLPNPCRAGDCIIAISNITSPEMLLQLKDMAGRVVYSKIVQRNGYLMELPVLELKQFKGLYFLTAATKEQVIHQRILLE